MCTLYIVHTVHALVLKIVNYVAFIDFEVLCNFIFTYFIHKTNIGTKIIKRGGSEGKERIWLVMNFLLKTLFLKVYL